MNDYKYLSKVISDHLKADSPVVLVSIISMEGSTPRESGTKMVVAGDGATYGTVGGSLLEATAITMARKMLVENHPALLNFDLTGNSTSSDGMICGGKAVLLLDYLSPTAANKSIFERIHDFISGGKSFYFLTAFNQSDDLVSINGHNLIFSDGTVIGDDILSQQDLPAVREELQNISSTTVLSLDDRKFLIDPVSRTKTMYCFGAGHVAVPTARIAAMVGFNVVVIDDRDEFANDQRFPEASRVLVINDFAHALDNLEIDEDSYIVIVTRGHKYDRIVLEQAIKTEAGYIGMISSRAKRNAIYKTLLAEGLATEEDLARIHSPIGLPIGGETPEEIAVSIVAEMISVREKPQK